MRAYAGGGPDLIWYGAAGNRTKLSIIGFGILDGYRGVLVRDDYGGYLSYDAGLAGVQQCLAHLYRYLDDAYATGPASQVWTRQAGGALREAAAAVTFSSCSAGSDNGWRAGPGVLGLIMADTETLAREALIELNQLLGALRREPSDDPARPGPRPQSWPSCPPWPARRARPGW